MFVGRQWFYDKFSSHYSVISVLLKLPCKRNIISVKHLHFNHIAVRAVSVTCSSFYHIVSCFFGHESVIVISAHVIIIDAPHQSRWQRSLTHRSIESHFCTYSDSHLFVSRDADCRYLQFNYIDTQFFFIGTIIRADCKSDVIFAHLIF